MTQTIWTARRLVTRSEHDRVGVYDSAGVAIATMADADMVLRDMAGRPQMTLRTFSPARGAIAFTATHPGGGAYGNICLDRQIYKSIRLHLYDPAGNRVAGLQTLDRAGREAVIVENGGRLLARTVRSAQSGRVAEDTVDLTADDLDGGYRALVLMAAIRVPHWQRVEWVEMRFSPTTF